MSVARRDTPKFARSRPQNVCARCRDILFMPEWSECLDERRVRHFWQCDACGYAFETTVYYEAEVEAA